MQIYHSPNSPFVRIVMMTAGEAGVADRIELLPTDVWKEGAAVTAVNPLGQIPTLVCENGEILYDSSVICEYLDARYNAGGMLPADPAMRWRILRQRALGGGLLNAAVIRALEIRRRPAKLRWPELLARQQAIMERVYDTLETETASFGARIDLGQIAVACALAYVDLRLAEDGWRTGRPTLAEWFARITQRRSFIDSAPPVPDLVASRV